MRGGRPSIRKPGGLAFLGLTLIAAAGCSEASRESTSSEPAATSLFANRLSTAPATPAEGTRPARDAVGEAAPPESPRKIIYNAQVELVVDNVAATAEALGRLVRENGGYVSETDQQSDAQEQRRATWKVKVPVDRFDPFLAAVVRLGEPRKHHVDSQEVTQEYYDLEARVTNKREEEKRLLKHLHDSTGKLDEILTVERELSRVRGEVEQMQGRIRLLSHLSALSTVTITAFEIKDYTPPVSPSFPTQVARTFALSLAQLADLGKAVALVVVALAPWLVVAAALALPAWLLLRRRAFRPAPSPPGRA